MPKGAASGLEDGIAIIDVMFSTLLVMEPI
jgi:hypothetical protein